MTSTTSQRQRRQLPMRAIWLAVAAVVYLFPLIVEFDKIVMAKR